MAFQSRPKFTDLKNKKEGRAYKFSLPENLERLQSNEGAEWKVVNPKEDQVRSMAGGKVEGDRYIAGGQVLTWQPEKLSIKRQQDHADYVLRTAANKQKNDMEEHGLVDMREVRAEDAYRASGKMTVTRPEFKDDFDWNQGKEKSGSSSKRKAS